MKILLAEDEEDLQEVMVAYLTHQGYTVVAVDNGAQAVEKARSDAFDALVLDIMMPVMDGLSALKHIRAEGNLTPAIFLTAKSEVQDRILGLDTGADDYLSKPFALDELCARLRALNRRRRDYRLRLMSFGNVELDTEHAELRAHNTIGLALKEVKLLSILMSNTDRMLTSDDLLREVWEGEQASEDVVWMYVSFLRAKLQSILADIDIEGDRTVGFRLGIIRERRES